MANFIAIVDPDTERRNRFLSSVAPLLPPFQGLVAGSCSAPPFAAIWAAHAQAPISASAEDGAAIVFGPALRGESGTEIDARELRELWRDGEGVPEPFDGYYAAITYDASAELLAGGDILGRFPLYYFHSGDVLIVGSSPELFPRHDSFRTAFDPAGLIGVLLTNGFAEGRTLWSSVRRLAPGHLLAARPGQAPREIRQYEIPLGERYFDQPFERHVEILDHALERAVRRHVPKAPRPGMLLSGGLDSRTIAGYLDRIGVAPLAVTRGEPRDFEMLCAVHTARALGFEHRAEAGDEGFRVADARARARWEHCAAGFSGAGGWGGHRQLEPFGTRVVTGYSMDWIIGGNEASAKAPSFRAYFDHSNRWGLTPDVLRRLVRRDVFNDAVSDVMSDLERRYQSYSDVEAWRVWCFSLAHRQRFHIGGTAWPMTFGAWPIVPAVDMEVLAVAAGMPASSLDGRRLQIALVCEKFPKLARLPLDRNSPNMDPLLPSFAYRVRRALRRRVRRFFPPRPPSEERRRYYRQFDINNAGWRGVREAAEPFRRLAHEYFEPAVLDELLPPPQAHVELADSITGSAGMKSLLGFMLWLGREAGGRAPTA